MNKNKNPFSTEQLKILKEIAESLKVGLSQSTDPAAIEFLNGDLGEIIDEIIFSDVVYPYENIPHFEKMTRDYLPDIEHDYFNFYSMAKFGEIAYKD